MKAVRQSVSQAGGEEKHGNLEREREREGVKKKQQQHKFLKKIFIFKKQTKQMNAEHKLEEILKYTTANELIKLNDDDDDVDDGSCVDEYDKFRQWFLQQFQNDKTETNNDDHNDDDDDDDDDVEKVNSKLIQFANYYLDNLHAQTCLHMRVRTEFNNEQQQQQQKREQQNDEEEEAATENSINLNTTNDDSMTSYGLSFDNSSGLLCNTNTTNEDSSISISNNNNKSLPYKKYDTMNAITTTTMITPNMRNRKSLPESQQQQQQQQRSGNRIRTTTLQLGDFLMNTTKSTTTTEATPSFPTTTTVITQIQQQKKIKRVQPLTVSRNLFETQTTHTIFSGSSAFSNDNNIMNISKNVIEKGTTDMEAERKSMQRDVNNITKLIKVATPITTSTPTKSDRKLKPQNCQKFKHLPNKREVQIFAAIYCILLQYNYVNNILQEIAFLFTLLNTAQTSTSQPSHSEMMSKLELLQDTQKSIYFAALVLTQQKHDTALFTYLDLKTLHTILCSERLAAVATHLHAHLTKLHDEKQLSISSAQKQHAHPDMRTLHSVYLNEAEDLRKNFPNNLAFQDYKVQRDAFFKILKLWELHHLRPQWSFEKAAACKVREIFNSCEHPVNMQHLAKLFINKLLSSYNYSSMTPHEVGLDVNMQKFHLLSQRLVNPEHYNMNYDFPGHQLFFCEFLLSSRSIAFTQQLQMQLYERLLELNNNTKCEYTLLGEHVLHAEVLKNMLILAKFLAYVLKLPYIAVGQELPMAARQQQLQLRQQFAPLIDTHQLLMQALAAQKMLITLPWLVQYLGMLDDIELSLPLNLKTLHLMFSLLIYGREKCLTPCAYFVLRCCVSWLCARKPHCNEQLLKFRCLGKNLTKQLPRSVGRAAQTTAPLVYLLEEIIKASCPALAQFRADILHCTNAYMKSISRTGRYRHITTRYHNLQQQASAAGELSSLEAGGSQQQLLWRAFLAQQAPGMRRLLDFLMEQIKQLVMGDVEQQLLKRVIRDVENAFLEPESALPEHVDELQEKVELAFIEERLKILPQFEQFVEECLNRRIDLSLQALLPLDTKAQMRQVYASFIKGSCKRHMQEFRETQVDNNQYFVNHIKDLTQRLLKQRQLEAEQLRVMDSRETQIVSSEVSVSAVIDEFQHWLYLIASRQESFMVYEQLFGFLEQRVKRVFVHKLPKLFYRSLSQNLVQLLQQLIINFPQLARVELFEIVCQILKHEAMSFASHDKLKVEPFVCMADMQQPELSLLQVNYLKCLINVNFVRNLADCEQRFDIYGDMLKKFLAHGLINVKFVNEQFLSVFKLDWESTTLQLMSNLLRDLSTYANTLSPCTDTDQQDSDSESSKDNLFLELLADISNDQEFL